MEGLRKTTKNLRKSDVPSRESNQSKVSEEDTMKLHVHLETSLKLRVITHKTTK
jgi:hypothetical protein